MAAISDSQSLRRRVLYIQNKPSVDFVGFQVRIEDEFRDTLALHCDVTTIENDFDYDAVCSAVKPDFVVLATPSFYRADLLNIANPRAHPSIPKIGLFFQNPNSTSRLGFLRQMDQLGIDKFFVFTTAAVRAAPDFCGRTFTTSLFFDDTVFHDYDEEKVIPMSIFGGTREPRFYKWRAELITTLPDRIPTFVYTHPGYMKPTPAARFPIDGELYARMLNRSYFSLSDCTRYNYVVRKHLEIPASGAILVSPDFAELHDYGFIDMQNCILGDSGTVIDKIETVAADPIRCQTMAQAGYTMVHSRHRRQNWKHVLNWYECARARSPGETVQQQGCFGSFEAVPDQGEASSVAISDYGTCDYSTLMNAALSAIIAKTSNLDEIFNRLEEAHTWIGHIDEAHLMQGIIRLLQGRRLEAMELFNRPNSVRSAHGGTEGFDPEEIHWLWLAAMLDNSHGLAHAIAKHGEGMNAIGLRRMFLLQALLNNPALSLTETAALSRRQVRDRLSIHRTACLSWDSWQQLVMNVLKANAHGQATSSKTPLPQIAIG